MAGWGGGRVESVGVRGSGDCRRGFGAVGGGEEGEVGGDAVADLFIGGGGQVRGRGGDRGEVEGGNWEEDTGGDGGDGVGGEGFGETGVGDDDASPGWRWERSGRHDGSVCDCGEDGGC